MRYWTLNAWRSTGKRKEISSMEFDKGDVIVQIIHYEAVLNAIGEVGTKVGDE